MNLSRKDSTRPGDYRSLDRASAAASGPSAVHNPSNPQGTIMKTSLSRLVLSCAVLAAAASFSLPSLAQDVKREDSVTYYLQTKMIDADKDGMVSKKEFMAAMSKTWDMHMADARKADPMMPKDKMTLQQYLDFSKMFGLNIGG
jgi:hypothetical protein